MSDENILISEIVDDDDDDISVDEIIITTNNGPQGIVTIVENTSDDESCEIVIVESSHNNVIINELREPEIVESSPNNINTIENKKDFEESHVNRLTSPTFINAYSISDQKIKKNDVVVFDITNMIHGNCAHIPNTSDIYIWRTGCYSVYISILHIEACQFSLLKNSQYTAPVSVVGSVNAATQNSNFFMIQINDSDMITPTSLSPSGYACKLQLVNNTNNCPSVTLGSYSSGNQLPHITASITIQSII